MAGEGEDFFLGVEGGGLAVLVVFEISAVRDEVDFSLVAEGAKRVFGSLVESNDGVAVFVEVFEGFVSDGFGEGGFEEFEVDCFGGAKLKNSFRENVGGVNEGFVIDFCPDQGDDREEDGVVGVDDVGIEVVEEFEEFFEVFWGEVGDLKVVPVS